MAPKKQTKKSQKPSATTIELLRVNLGSSSSLVDAQVEAGLNRESAINSLYENMRSQMKSLTFDAIDHKVRVDLMQLCNAGPWSDDQRRDLASLLAAEINPDANALQAKNQKALHFENLLMQSDWITIRNKSHSKMLRAHTLALAAARVNLRNPCEMTLFRMVSILTWAAQDYDMTQGDVWNLMTQIQDMVKDACKGKPEVSYLAELPFSATSLPEDLKDRYKGDIPIEVVIPELDSILAGRRARGGRGPNAPGKHDPEWLKSLPTEELKTQARNALMKARAPDADASTIKREQNNQHLGVMPLPSTTMKMEPDNTHLATNLKMEPDRPAAASADLQSQLYQLTNHAAARYSRPTSGTGEEEPDHSLEDMERALGFSGIMKRAPKAAGARKTTMRRPAAALKRPAAALKRPATAITTYSSAALKLERTIDMKDIFDKLKKALTEPNINRNKFTSRAYKNAESRAKARKATNDLAKEYARMQIRKASSMWDKHFS